MRTVPVSEFRRLISPVAEGAPDFVIDRAIVDTVNDICRKTGCIVSQAGIKTKKGISSYDFDLPAGIKAESVLRMYCNGRRVHITNADELDRKYPEDFEKEFGTPRHFFFRKPSVIELVPCPDAEYFCRMDITVSVRPDTTTVPEIFFTEYSEYVAHGVLARILLHAGTQYSNARQAQVYQRMYEKDVTAIKSEAMAGFHRTSGTVLPNRIV